MMKSFRAFLVTIAVVSASFQMPSMGAATVTASKNYVDMKTKVEVVTNAEVGVAGYTVGTNTNCVFASTNYVDSKLGNIKTDLITDGTNTIDAAGNVFLVETSNFSEWVKTADESGVSFTSLPYWTVAESGEGWYVDSFYLGNARDATRLEFGAEPFATVWERTAGLFVKTNYVGKLALTNDIPSAVSVVAPSTNATEGTAADARATGTALYTGFTEWEFSGSGYDPSHKYKVEAPMEDGDRWDFYLSRDGTLIDDSYSDTDEPTKLVFTISQITATRRLVTPTKTSQLENDGPKDGLNVGHPFATTDQIPAPVDISGKLDGAAAYPAWMAGSYGEDSIVSHNGRLWKCILSTTVEPSDSLGGDWVSVTINSLKMDALTAAQTNAVNSGVTSAKVASWDGYAALISSKVSTNALANKPVYDFSKNYDIIRATADIVQLLGGTVTNNPTANQGGN